MWYASVTPPNSHPLFFCIEDQQDLVSDDWHDATPFRSVKDCAQFAKILGYRPPQNMHVRHCVRVSRMKTGLMI